MTGRVHDIEVTVQERGPWILDGGNTGGDERARSVLIDYGKIVDVMPAPDERGEQWAAARQAQRIDMSGLSLFPGIIDLHTHFLGGGGFAGYTSRSPELQLSDYVRHGTTTVVGVPGFDMMSRSAEGLVAKAYALSVEGLTAFVFTGGFDLPTGHITGSIKKDCYLLPVVRGVKIALGEVRAADVSQETLLDLAAEMAWAAAATGRKLVLHVHLGARMEGHRRLLKIAEHAPDGVTVMGTHMNRSAEHMATARTLLGIGGHVDMTAMLGPGREGNGSLDPADCVEKLCDERGDLARITVSSDSNGAVPVAGAEYRRYCDSLLTVVRSLVSRGWPLHRAMWLVTENPARALGIHPEKGALEPRSDADIVAIDASLGISEVFSGGRRMVAHGRLLAKGRFESRD
jgi:beta-aspartyl-dipeptidase (metallo-type)